MQKLNTKAMAFGLGISCAVYALFLGWAAAFGWGVKIVEMVSSLYLGFRPGFLGGIIGAIWAFIDGAIGGAIIAWAYNAFMSKD